MKGLDVHSSGPAFGSGSWGGDPRTDKRIDFIGGIRGLKASWSAGYRGYGSCVLHASHFHRGAVSSGRCRAYLMPPKSTWFEPKLQEPGCLYIGWGRGRGRALGLLLSEEAGTQPGRRRFSAVGTKAQGRETRDHQKLRRTLMSSAPSCFAPGVEPPGVTPAFPVPGA